jgi:hypothetical protein
MAARARSRFDRDEVGPQNDVYTGLLAISLVAMLVSCVLLYLDYNQYAGKAQPPQPPQPAPRPVATGQLAPPPPLDERPTVQNGVAELPVKPASALELPAALPPLPSEVVAPVPQAPVAQPPDPSVIPAAGVLPLVPLPVVPVPPAATKSEPTASEPPPLPKSIKDLPKSGDR